MVTTHSVACARSTAGRDYVLGSGTRLVIYIPHAVAAEGSVQRE